MKRSKKIALWAIILAMPIGFFFGFLEYQIQIIMTEIQLQQWMK